MLFDDSYKTIEGPANGLFKDKGSRFLGLAYPVRKEEEVRAIIRELKKEHHQANHHCYAFRLGPDRTHFRFNDDREPSGTAGKPILNQILAADLTDILLVVVRYFGGSLLGVPGLINAYKEAAGDTLKHVTVIHKYLEEKYKVVFGYESMNEIMGLLKSYNAVLIRQEASENCWIEFTVRKSFADELTGRMKKIFKSGQPVRIDFVMP